MFYVEHGPALTGGVDKNFWRPRASSKSTIIFGNSANKLKRKLPQKG